MPVPPTPDAAPDRTLNAQISNLIVRLLSNRAGRGPTKARTYICEDLVTTVLKDTLTRGEQTLAGAGHSDVVRANRRAYHKLIGPELITGVETIVDRTVMAILTDDHFDPDVTVISLVLGSPEN